MINWTINKFELLSNNTLYDILALREEVFTIEQKCTVIDLDGIDKRAIHVVGISENNVVATARISPPNTYKKGKVIFGRLAIKKDFRGQGFGDELMLMILQYITTNYQDIPIECSAQLYLKSFYEKYGFVSYGDVYDDGGIPHISMTSLS